MRSPADHSGALGRRVVAGATVGRRSRRRGVAAGAAVAALASAALVYGLGAGEPGRRGARPTASAPPTAYAPAKPDAEQVERAYDQLQRIYADQGERSVVDFAQACAASLRSDPGLLDFCLAFDIYAAGLGGDDEAVRDWRPQAAARDMALARNALAPGQEPAQRLAQVGMIARRTSVEALGAAAPAPAPRAKLSPSAAQAQASATEAPPPSRQPAAAVHRANADGSCRAKAEAGRRAVCASPALRDADRRLRLAYRRALRADADPGRLAHDQARFRLAVDKAAPDRAAIARLYHRRIQSLELLVRRPRAIAD